MTRVNHYSVYYGHHIHSEVTLTEQITTHYKDKHEICAHLE